VIATPTPFEGSAQAGPSLAVCTLGLSKHYGWLTALEDLTMSVPCGEIFGFLGPNGAGKTTAVKLLLGLTYPSGGEGFVLGAPLGDLETRRSIGYLPELFRYHDWLSAREVLEFHCGLAGVLRAKRRAEIEELLGTVGLRKRAGDRVGSFSKGMQQRLGLAVALVGKPKLIFLDEPTSALDPVGRHETRELLRSLRMAGTTVFLNSHLLTEVEHVCDRVAVVDRGKVIAIGPIRELLGGAFALRIGVESLADAFVSALRPFGRVEAVDNAYVIGDIDESQVPEVVAALVSAGARVRFVEPVRRSLETHFLRLLQGSADAAARDR
jgi:ABC-2 type transport system ATP-binding protein